MGVSSTDKPTPRLSEYQFGQVKRFALGVTVLIQEGWKVRLDRRKAKRILLNGLDPSNIPDDQIPDLDDVLAQHWTQFFTVLDECNSRDKKAWRLSAVLAAGAFVLALYYWYIHGILAGISTLVLAAMSVVIIHFIVAFFYVWRGFSPLAWGVTHTEAQFAQAIINRPDWQNKRHAGD